MGAQAHPYGVRPKPGPLGPDSLLNYCHNNVQKAYKRNVRIYFYITIQYYNILWVDITVLIDFIQIFYEI